MKTILINGVNAKVGGGLSVLRNLLRIAAQQDNNTRYIVAVDHSACLDITSANIEYITLPKMLARSAFYPFVYRYWLPRLARKCRATSILNLGDLPICSDIHQVMLVDTPYFAYPESPAWERLGIIGQLRNRIKIWIFKTNLHFVDVVVAQTTVMRDRINALYGLSCDQVIPNAVAFDHVETSSGKSFDLSRACNLLCLTHYYTHKNLEIFVPLGKLLLSQGLNVRILITIEEEQHPGARRLLQNLKAEGLDNIIVNLGRVEMVDVPQLFAQSDGLLLPTLLESFTGTYLEAMHHGKPILTSDLDFARTCCGEAAFYFDPFDASDVLRCIELLQKSTYRREHAVECGRKILSASPTWEENFFKFSALLHRYE